MNKLSERQKAKRKKDRDLALARIFEGVKNNSEFMIYSGYVYYENAGGKISLNALRKKYKYLAQIEKNKSSY